MLALDTFSQYLNSGYVYILGGGKELGRKNLHHIPSHCFFLTVNPLCAFVVSFLSHVGRLRGCSSATTPAWPS